MRCYWTKQLTETLEMFNNTVLQQCSNYESDSCVEQKWKD